MLEILPLLTKVALTIFAYMNILFLISLFRKRVDLVDIGWGFGFVIIAFVSLTNQYILTNRMILVFFLVLLWGIRLSTHIARRNWRKEEDYRYQNFRKQWGAFFNIKAYFQIFLLQGLLMIVISLPILFISTFSTYSLGILDYIGLAVWITGFLLEMVADNQLKYFIEQKKAGNTKGRFADIGLWKYSRHPNYFGEILQWWGIGLIALSLPYGYIALIGPSLISYLIVFVSGIPLLTKKFEKDPEWKEYKESRRLLIPLPKKI